jgi:hypothetical protein
MHVGTPVASPRTTLTRDPGLPLYRAYRILAIVLMCSPRAAYAQQASNATPGLQGSTVDAKPPPQTPDLQDSAVVEPPPPPDLAPVPAANQGEPGKTGDRIFGVLPNYTTVEGATRILPVSTRQKFHMFVQDSFDPYVFPYIGVVAALGQGQGTSGYVRRYGMALADNSIGNCMTEAVVPSAIHQDPRYFELGRGGLWHRAGYAMSRIVVTRGDAGGRQFNVSEVGGNFLAAGMSNLYYPAGDRSVANTLTRWGTLVMWDTVSNELKEFWPDIRRKIRKL